MRNINARYPIGRIGDDVSSPKTSKLPSSSAHDGGNAQYIQKRFVEKGTLTGLQLLHTSQNEF